MGVFISFCSVIWLCSVKFFIKKTFWTFNICTKSMISGFLEFYIPYIHASHTMWHCHTPCYSLLTLQNHSILSVNYVVLIRIRISTARGCNLPLGFLDKDRIEKASESVWHESESVWHATQAWFFHCTINVIHSSLVFV